VQLLKEAGGTYANGHETNLTKLASHFGAFDFIFEAAGSAQLDIELFSALGPNGIYVLTGIPGSSRTFNVSVEVIMRNFVLKNQLLFGSVNADKKHWEMAVRDMEKINNTFNGIMEKLITHRVPYQEFRKVFFERTEDEVKTALVWGHFEPL
jgi:threonine dehydrogenase-like Zn-dependent dehydrogenase